NTEILRWFGAAQRIDIRRGIGPRVDRMIRSVADRVSRNEESLEKHLPMLEFVARRYPPAWLLLASLHEEFEEEGSLDRAKEAVRRYLEVGSDASVKRTSWERLAKMCRRSGDLAGEIHALIGMSELPGVAFEV